MFDGNLFKQNLAFIVQWKESNPGVPLFNYVMTIYGHTPNLINTTKRPKIIDVKGDIKDEQLERAVNQYYYRTEAIADFLNELQTIDPQSLVILVSDHIPPLVYGPNTYQKLEYLAGDKDFMHINRIFFFENGRAVHYDTIHHYDIPYIILNYITNGSYCRNHTCDFKTHPNPTKQRDYREAYMTIMAQAMNL
jgi:phosphoglycerol transferase MdoB-like AlkP superfamily enzyme